MSFRFKLAYFICPELKEDIIQGQRLKEIQDRITKKYSMSVQENIINSLFKDFIKRKNFQLYCDALTYQEYIFNKHNYFLNRLKKEMSEDWSKDVLEKKIQSLAHEFVAGSTKQDHLDRRKLKESVRQNLNQSDQKGVK